jgi:catechol 2,3-dioxygenase-like lactoylglutathione lyase family enzyme
MPTQTLTAIVPCNDLDASEAFYVTLGFRRRDKDKPPPGHHDSYRILENDAGGALHLTETVEGWVVPGRNPFGLYFYTEDVDGIAAQVRDRIIEKDGPGHKPWGMYEFALSDPDGTLIRIGWPSRLQNR